MRAPVLQHVHGTACTITVHTLDTRLSRLKGFSHTVQPICWVYGEKHMVQMHNNMPILQLDCSRWESLMLARNAAGVELTVSSTPTLKQHYSSPSDMGKSQDTLEATTCMT